MPVTIRNKDYPISLDICMHGYCQEGCVTCPKMSQVKTLKYLGVYFDHLMKWNSHIGTLTDKLRKVSFVLSGINFLQTRIVRMAYMALAQSLLSFGIVVWGGTYRSLMDPLARMQKSLLKYSFKRPLKYSSKLLFSELKILSVYQLYVKQILIFLIKEKNKFNITFRVSRGKPYRVVEEKRRLNFSLMSPGSRALRIFNNLFDSLFHLLGVRHSGRNSISKLVTETLWKCDSDVFRSDILKSMYV